MVMSGALDYPPASCMLAHFLELQFLATVGL